jgi:hypothetical protein
MSCFYFYPPVHIYWFQASSIIKHTTKRAVLEPFFFFTFSLSYFYFSLAFIIGRPTGVISAVPDCCCCWLGFCCGIASVHPHPPPPARLFAIDPRTHTHARTNTHKTDSRLHQADTKSKIFGTDFLCVVRAKLAIQGLATVGRELETWRQIIVLNLSTMLLLRCY